MKNKKKGISLIVLVITIIIILILAGVVLLSLSNNNPIENANKAVIMQDIDTFKSELSISIANKVANMEISSTSQVNVAGYAIFDYIPSMQGRKVNGLNYSDILVVSNGVLAINNEAAIPEETRVVISQALNGISATVVPGQSNPTTPASKTAGSISYNEKNLGKIITDSAFINTLTKEGDGIVTYASSDTSVATVDENTGEVTVVGAGETTITATVADSDDYSYSVKTATYNLIVYTEDGGITVAQAKKIITPSNISSYIGTKVSDYSPSTDTTGVYRIFYLDTNGKYDDEGTLYIKRDYDSSISYYVTSNVVSSSNYSIDDYKKFNPSVTKTSLSAVNETHSAYMCTKSNATTYVDSSKGGEYAILSSSVELFMDAYNEWKGTKALDYQYVTTGATLSRGTAAAEGYSVAPVNSAITDFGTYTDSNSVEAGPNNIFIVNTSYYWWFASPSCDSTGSLNRLHGIGHGANVGNAKDSSSSNGTYGICPVVSLGVCDYGAFTVEEAKRVINEENMSEYIGRRVEYTTESDPNGVYRIFYLDTVGKYDKEGTLFIKRDYDSSATYTVGKATDAPPTSYTLSDMERFNPAWKNADGTIDSYNEKYAAYLSSKINWTAYKSSNAEYAIGSPSVEMFIDSYNQWKGTKTLDYSFVTSGTIIAYGTSGANTAVGSNGYAYAPALNTTSITSFGTVSAHYSVEAGELEKTIYMYGLGSQKHYWLASPSCDDAYDVSYIASYYANISGMNDRTYGICPVVSLGN